MLVSVVIPVYNSEKYVSSAITSILNQSYCNLEVIVVDDGSNDRTPIILEEIKRVDHRVTVYRQTNQGISSALNRGIMLSSGEWIARMDSDDIANCNRIRNQIDFINKNPLVDILSSNYSIITESDAFQSTIFHPLDDIYIKYLLTFSTPICHPAVIMRASIIKKFLYSPCAIAEDHDLWIRLAQNGAVFANISEPLINYRVLQNSLTKKNRYKISFSVRKNGLRWLFNNSNNFSKLNIFDLLFKKNNENWNVRNIDVLIYFLIIKIHNYLKGSKNLC